MQAKKDKGFPHGKYIILYPDASDIIWQQNVTKKETLITTQSGYHCTLKYSL